MNDSKTKFSSKWDTDLILYKDEVDKTVVSNWQTNFTELYDYSSLKLNFVPVVFITYKKFGESERHMQGAGIFPVVDSSKIYVGGNGGDYSIRFYILNKEMA